MSRTRLQDLENENGYRAPKPQLTWSQTFGAIVFWVFPPTAFWGLLQLSANYLIGKTLGNIVLPAADNEVIKAEAEEYREGFPVDAEFNFSKSKVITHDNAVLDTLEIQQKSQDESSANANDRIHIINFVGNGMCYEQIVDEMRNDAKDLKANIIGFNLRGVGLSSGKARSSNDLITDGIAEVKRLIDRGVNPENIYLKGHSLGAGIASLVASHMHQRGQKVILFNGRSFSSLTNNVVGWIRTGFRTGHSESLGGKILGWMAKPFVKFALVLTKWEIEAAEAYKSIPDTYKEYMLVRTSRQKRTERHWDDPVIPHYGSLHLALREERRLQKYWLDQGREATLNGSSYLVRKETRESIQSNQKASDRLKERKMEVLLTSTNGHAVHLSDLKDRYKGRDANHFFHRFVRRSKEHHDKQRLLQSVESVDRRLR